jgi:hypothetical protein
MRSRAGIIQSGYTATEENCPEAYLAKKGRKMSIRGLIYELALIVS